VKARERERKGGGKRRGKKGEGQGKNGRRVGKNEREGGRKRAGNGTVGRRDAMLEPLAWYVCIHK
jgi:hypothetical protein